MTRHCQLYLEAGELSAWQRKQGQAQEIARFADTPDGLARFSAFLAVDRKTRYSLLVNLPDEIFVSESLPRLRRSERQEVLAAKARRLFPDTPWHCATRSQSDETRFLLLALGQSAPLSRWTDRIKAANSALDSLHSLPQLLPVLLKKSLPHKPSQPNPALLTLSLHDNSARFSLLTHGYLRISRLSQLTEGATLADEYRRFVDHITRQCGLEAGTALCVIGDAEQLAQIDLPNIVDRITSPATNSAGLFLAIPRQQWPREQFAPLAMRQPARQQRQTEWLWRSAVLLLLLGAAISLERLNSELRNQAAIETIQDATRRIDTAIAQNDQLLTHSSLNREQLQQLAQDHPKLLAQSDAFSASLLALSQSLERSPAIELARIDWKIDGFPPSTATMQVDGQIKHHNGTSANLSLRHFHEQLKARQAVSILNAPSAQPGATDLPFSLLLSQREKP
ncbi:hypothetical protein [Azonexus sp.]|uniref:hypothetical protein n=1 Tax=Azonexus sp. TaxID=1872668 RepID=UPI0027B8AA14|nr:hypothetical protein [Azonexus sp.]